MKLSMPATTMFSKFKSGGGTQSPLETNPIGQFFEIGKQTASAGPELVWRIHDAYRKSDGKVCSETILHKRCRKCDLCLIIQKVLFIFCGKEKLAGLN